MTREQLGALILDSERQLYSTAKTILYSDQDCADAIQDTIVKAFSKIDTLKNDKYARTWLVRILINECYSILRKSSKLVSLEEMNDKGESGGSMKTCGGADKEAEKRADYAELYRAVTVSYTHLDVYKRQGLRMHWKVPTVRSYGIIIRKKTRMSARK